MQKRQAIWVILMIIALFIVACGGEEETPAPAPTPTAQAAQPVATGSKGDAVVGKQLFATTCAACHGPTGEGVKGLGKNMTTSEFIAGLSDEEMVAFVKKGRPIGDALNTTGVDMPPKGGNPALSDEQLLHIIAFIRTIHKP